MPNTALADRLLAGPASSGLAPPAPAASALPDTAMLMPGRVHEAVGPGRMAFALALAGQAEGPVLWIRDARLRDGLYPPGLAAFFDPARLILVHPTGPLAVLQTAEEALRDGAAPLVVAELATAPDLTASRRLQLAAGTGGGRGLCLIPEGQLCNNAAETRWMCMPMPGLGAGGQHWEAIKNKRGRLITWRARTAGGRFMAAEEEVA